MKRSLLAICVGVMALLFLTPVIAYAQLEVIKGRERQQFDFELAKGVAKFQVGMTCGRSDSWTSQGCGDLNLSIYNNKKRLLESGGMTCKTVVVREGVPGTGEEDVTEQKCGINLSITIPAPATYSAVVSNEGEDKLSFGINVQHTDSRGIRSVVYDNGAGNRQQRVIRDSVSELGIAVPKGPVVPGSPLDYAGYGEEEQPERPSSNKGGAVKPKRGVQSNRPNSPAPTSALPNSGVVNPARSSPAKEPAVPVVKRPPTISEIIGGAEADFRYGRYDRAISACLEVLKIDPDQPQGNLLLGRAYYQTKNFEKSIPYLAKAISLGEKMTFPIAHHRKVFAGRSDNGTDNDLNMGEITLQKDYLELRFTSNTTKTGVRVSDESFSIPLSSIYELKHEPDKEEKLKLVISVPSSSGAGKEKRKTYNFYPGDARVEKTGPKFTSLSDTEIRCVSCSPTTKLVYDLLLSLRK